MISKRNIIGLVVLVIISSTIFQSISLKPYICQPAVNGILTTDPSQERKNPWQVLRDNGDDSSLQHKEKTSMTQETSKATISIPDTLPTYILNLKARPDRLEKMLSQLKGMEPSPRVIEAVDGNELRPSNNSLTRGEVGIFMTQLRALELIAKGNYSYGLVLEDDAGIVLPRDLEQVFSFMREAPLDCDILSLGTNYLPPESLKVSEHIYLLNGGGLFGAHAIIYHKNAAAAILEHQKWVEHHIDQRFWYPFPYDIWLARPWLPAKLYFVSPPFVKQTSGYSDTQGRVL